MKIYIRVTRFVTLRNLSVSHELLVTSRESVGVTTSIVLDHVGTYANAVTRSVLMSYACRMHHLALFIFFSSVVPGTTLSLLET